MIDRPMAESDGRSDAGLGNSVSEMKQSKSGHRSAKAAQYGRLQHSAVALRAMADKADTAPGCPVSPAGGMEDRLGLLRKSQLSIPRPSVRAAVALRAMACQARTSGTQAMLRGMSVVIRPFVS